MFCLKFISTVHPDFRDGLLRGNLEEIETNESIFHYSPHDYYESRPVSSDDSCVNYIEEEKLKDYCHSPTTTR